MIHKHSLFYCAFFRVIHDSISHFCKLSRFREIFSTTSPFKGCTRLRVIARLTFNELLGAVPFTAFSNRRPFGPDALPGVHPPSSGLGTGSSIFIAKQTRRIAFSFVKSKDFVIKSIFVHV